MRNKWLLGIGAALAVLGIVWLAAGGRLPAIYLTFMGIVLVVAGFLVGPRYAKELDSPPAGFAPTGETFVDPTSRRTIEVWQHPSTGQRVYVRRG